MKLKGSDQNPLGIDSRVFVKTSDNNQMQELTLSRGFQSSVSTYLNFGVGNEEIIESVKVLWPDGKTEQLNTLRLTLLLNLILKTLE